MVESIWVTAGDPRNMARPLHGGAPLNLAALWVWLMIVVCRSRNMCQFPREGGKAIIRSTEPCDSNRRLP